MKEEQEMSSCTPGLEAVASAIAKKVGTTKDKISIKNKSSNSPKKGRKHLFGK